MLSIFLGLTASNLILLLTVFALGFAHSLIAASPTLHITLGIAAGLMTAFAHLAVYTYFMATARWLHAATDKANLPPNTYIQPALNRKSRALRWSMLAITTVLLTMFAGAAADPSVNPWWSSTVHLLIAAIAITTNLLAALVQFKLIQAQSNLIRRALHAVNQLPPPPQPAPTINPTPTTP